METSLTSRLYRGVFAAAVLAALGFGATQAAAAPSAPKKITTDCSTCAAQCIDIRLCYPGYCQCA